MVEPLRLYAVELMKIPLINILTLILVFGVCDKAKDVLPSVKVPVTPDADENSSMTSCKTAVETVAMVCLTFDAFVKYKLVPSNSIAPASAVVKLVPAVNLMGAVLAVAVPALICKLAVGVIPIPKLPETDNVGIVTVPVKVGDAKGAAPKFVNAAAAVVAPVPPFATIKVPAKVTAPVVAVAGVNPVVPPEIEVTPPPVDVLPSAIKYCELVPPDFLKEAAVTEPFVLTSVTEALPN